MTPIQKLEDLRTGKRKPRLQEKGLLHFAVIEKPVIVEKPAPMPDFVSDLDRRCYADMLIMVRLLDTHEIKRRIKHEFISQVWAFQAYATVLAEREAA